MFYHTLPLLFHVISDNKKYHTPYIYIYIVLCIYKTFIFHKHSTGMASLAAAVGFHKFYKIIGIYPQPNNIVNVKYNSVTNNNTMAISFYFVTYTTNYTACFLHYLKH